MAVIRTQKDALPSDVVPGGDAGGSTPATSVDRTKSALAGQKTAAKVGSTAGRAVERRTPGTPVARNAGASQVSTAPASPRTFVNDTQAELKRVVWPTTEEVRAGTIVTVMLLIFFSLYIFVLDKGAEWVFHAIGLYSRTPGAGS